MSETVSLTRKMVPLIAALAYATAAIFIRWSDEAGPLVIASYRMLVATAFWLPYGLWRSKRVEPAPLSQRQKRWMVLAGVFLALHFATWITAFSYTTVASAVFLILTQPVFVAVAAHVLLGERLNRWNLVALALTILGAFVVFGGDLELGKEYLFGDLLALIGAIFAGGYLFIARLVLPREGSGEGMIPLYRYLPTVYGVSTLLLVLFALVGGESFGPFRMQTWLSLLMLGLLPTVIGHSLFNWAMRYLPALNVNIAIVGEPVGASILAFLLLGEIPSRGLLLGSPILIAAVLLVYLRPPGKRGPGSSREGKGSLARKISTG